MEELLQFLKEKGDPTIAKNLLVILKQNYGKLRKFELTRTNYRLKFNGSIDARDKIFYNEIASYKDKYSPELMRRFYEYWGERTHDGNNMKYELEKTWETGKRLATWFSNQQKRGY